MLSPSFALREFLRSQTAARMGREIVPSEADVENLRRLCQSLMQPIRDHLGRAIAISSGLRPAWLNAAVGGSPNSAHLTGRAVDCTAVGMSAEMFARWIQRNGYRPDKCILEFPESSSGGWVHLQIARPGQANRGEFLVARRVGGRTVYEVMQ